jgi:hypothetical protein
MRNTVTYLFIKYRYIKGPIHKGLSRGLSSGGSVTLLCYDKNRAKWVLT